MKTIVIDPVAQTVTEEELTPNDKHTIHDIYRLLEIDCFDRVTFDNQHDLVVDDEGLFHIKGMFMFEGYPNPLANKACLFKNTRAGNWLEPKLTVEQVKAKVRFLTPVELVAIGVL